MWSRLVWCCGVEGAIDSCTYWAGPGKTRFTPVCDSPRCHSHSIRAHLSCDLCYEGDLLGVRVQVLPLML